jgi:hypothetical protein
MNEGQIQALRLAVEALEDEARAPVIRISDARRFIRSALPEAEGKTLTLLNASTFVVVDDVARMARERDESRPRGR